MLELPAEAVAAASSAVLVERADSIDEAAESADDDAADDEAGGSDVDEVAERAVVEVADEAVEDEAVEDEVLLPSLLCTNCTTLSVVLTLQ